MFDRNRWPSSTVGRADCGGDAEIDIPDYMGALYGLRGWWNVSQGYLRALHLPQVWTPGENTAYCLEARKLPFGSGDPGIGFTFNDRGVPTVRGGWEKTLCPGVAVDKHGCGFYAYHREYGLSPSGNVWGVIAMYGDVEIGPLGMRSSRARIVALLPRDLSDFEAVAEKYPSVPMFRETWKMLQEFPLTDPKEWVY